MTALILDPIYPSDDDRASQFVELAQQRMPRPVHRLPFFDRQMDGNQWLERLWAAVDEAEVLICLGDFTILRQAGADAPRLLQRIREKASEGCPVLFQVSGMRYKLTRGEAPEGMLELLRSFGCNPTDTKVGSELLATAAHSSPYACEFNDEDNCLNDPELFDGVNRLLGHGAYLLDYEAGSFAMIEASDLHILVDAKTDFRTAGILGRKNAVAIRRRSGQELQIILSIDLLRNGYLSLGGYVPGIQDNQKFAANIIDFIDREARAKDRDRADAYDLFATLERVLGQFVQDVLVTESRSGSLDEFFPRRVKDKLWDEKTQCHLYYKANFADIVELLRENWSMFKIYFNDDRSSVSRMLFGVNAEQRIHLAHPHKAHQLGIKFGRDDVRILGDALSLIQNANAKLKKAPRAQ